MKKIMAKETIVICDACGKKSAPFNDKLEASRSNALGDGWATVGACIGPWYGDEKELHDCKAHDGGREGCRNAIPGGDVADVCSAACAAKLLRDFADKIAEGR